MILSRIVLKLSMILLCICVICKYFIWLVYLIVYFDTSVFYHIYIIQLAMQFKDCSICLNIWCHMFCSHIVVENLKIKNSFLCCKTMKDCIKCRDVKLVPFASAFVEDLHCIINLEIDHQHIKHIHD